MSERNNQFCVIACEVVMEELRPILPDDVDYKVLRYGLHARPDGLRTNLQAAIDQVEGPGTILLGYGLCSRATVGLSSPTRQLVIPRVDDCISIFLGSREAYLEVASQEAGTYYLTKGWVEAERGPDGNYPRMEARYGKERAEKLMKMMLHNYKRLVFINTGLAHQQEHKEYARGMARTYGLRYEEIKGSRSFIEKMVHGRWADDFVVVPPGETVLSKNFFGF
jgi:hypothetical protein